MANVLQLAWCKFGKHRRARRVAWFDGSVWRSTCSGCGRPMYKEFDGWRLAEDAPPDREPGPPHDHA